MKEADYLTDPFNEVYEIPATTEPIELIETVLDKSFALPWKEAQSPIILSSILCRSQYSSILPLVVCYGPSGVGKSQLGKLVAGLYQLPSAWVLAGKTTATAIRNLIQAQKFGEDWVENGASDEQDAILVWDDINYDVLKDSTLLSILKSGYSRKSANVGIAQAGGTNLYFNCFSTKFTSTIHPFWNNQEYSELSRRIIVFPHIPYSEFSEECKEKNLDPDDLIDLDYVSFEGYQGMNKLAPDILELQELKKIRGNLRRAIKDSNFPSGFGKVCFDLLGWGVLYGVFHNCGDAVRKLENFWLIMQEPMNERNEFDYWLDRYLAGIYAVEKDNKLCQLNGCIELTRSQLMSAIERAIKEKEIPNNRYELAPVMKARGWKLVGTAKNTFEKQL